MSSTTKSCEYCGRIGELTENKDGDMICRRCDDPDYQCRGCKVEASKHCDECGGYGSGDEEEEDDECEVCDTKTKTTIKTYGCMDMIVCKNCEEPDDDEEEVEGSDKYKLWKSQSIEITCRKCGDIGHKHDWNDCDDDMKYGTCGACEEEEEERKPCEDCGYYELMENDEIYGNICECYADSTDVCGQTGRYFDSRNPLNGCGKKIREDDGDENIMIGNISFCIECAESSEGEKAMKYYEEEYEEEEEEEEVDKKKPVLRIVE